MLWGLLAAGLLIALGAYALLALTRALRTQRARSEERAAALMLELQQQTAAARSAAANAPIATQPCPPASAGGASPARLDAPGRVNLQALRRSPLLTDAQRLLYLVVRNALPDHIVLANMRAIDLLDLPAGPQPLARDPRLPALLHQRLDCVVCRPDWSPLAVLVLHPQASAASASLEEPAAMLRELGIRFLRFRSDSLPRPAEMRALILG